MLLEPLMYNTSKTNIAGTTGCTTFPKIMLLQPLVLQRLSNIMLLQHLPTTMLLKPVTLQHFQPTIAIQFYC